MESFIRVNGWKIVAAICALVIIALILKADPNALNDQCLRNRITC